LKPNLGPNAIPSAVEDVGNIVKNSTRLDSLAPFAELESFHTWRLPSWKGHWATHMTAPIMLGISEQDCFFEGTAAHVRECTSALFKSARVDDSLVKDAPHCLELTTYYMTRVSVSYAIEFNLDRHGVLKKNAGED
jgi:hypothetical protein